VEPQDLDLHFEYERAQIFADAGRPAEAARILAVVREAEPGNSDVCLRLALAYFKSAQLGLAEAELRSLVERDPSDHYAHHVLGRTLERMSRPSEALPHLRLANAMHDDEEYAAAVERVAGRVAGADRPSDPELGG
jgi:predicted Zn-dependent protease